MDKTGCKDAGEGITEICVVVVCGSRWNLWCGSYG